MVIHFGIEMEQIVYLVNINDNVGIGTNSPSHRLVVDSGNVDNYSYLGVRLDNNNRFIKMGNPGTDISQISVDDNDVLAFGQETSFEKMVVSLLN